MVALGASLGELAEMVDGREVFVPAGGRQFRRVEVDAGNILPGDKQEILSGIAPGQQVVVPIETGCVYAPGAGLKVGVATVPLLTV